MFEGMEPVEIEHEGTLLRGYAAVPEDSGPAPSVLVMHTALGIAQEFQAATARMLADQGYVAVCTDMYGAQLEEASFDSAAAAYVENQAEPEKQRARTVAWFDHIAERRDVDAERVAAVGFCYGGTTVLELARSGANVKAAISYHGILTTHAKAQRDAIRAHVVAYCGASDPYAPLTDVDGLRDELLDAGATFQITVFGAAAHGFTDPESGNKGLDGVYYEPLSDALARSGSLVLLQHVFERTQGTSSR